MAKKPAKTTQFTSESSAPVTSTGAQKAAGSRTKKHLKAQALGVAAAVEGFVNAITQTPAEPEPDQTAQPENRNNTADLTPVAAPPAQAAPVHENAGESAAPAPVSHEQIATLAYHYFESRKGQAGSPAEDWFRAEKALTAGR